MANRCGAELYVERERTADGGGEGPSKGRGTAGVARSHRTPERGAVDRNGRDTVISAVQATPAVCDLDARVHTTDYADLLCIPRATNSVN